MLEAIQYTIVYTNDMDSSLNFYEKILGMQIVRSDATFSTLALPSGSMLAIHLVSEEIINCPSGFPAEISFRVSDIHTAVQHLYSRGIPLTREITEIAPNTYVANFADPFGNPLSFVENHQ